MKLAVRLVTILVFAAAFGASTAAAQAKKKADPKAGAKAAPAKVDPRKPVVKKAEERKGPAKLDGRDSKIEDVVKEATADKKRDEQIEAAKKIIPKIEDGNPQKADLLFQLSELYWEKSSYLNRKEMLGFFTAQPETADLVPMFPWFGVVVVGMIGMRRLEGTTVFTWSSNALWARGLAWIGRWSLIISLVPQPLLFGIIRLKS